MTGSRLFVIAAVVWGMCAASAATAAEVRWYPSDQLDKAVETAKKLGRPIAILQQDPKSTSNTHNAQCVRWKRARNVEQFVCVMLDLESGAFDPPYLAKLRSNAHKQGMQAKEGEFIPRLYLGTWDGECLDVIPNGTTSDATAEALAAALKKFGPIMPAAKANSMWKNLESARALWAEKKYGSAMALYLQIKALEKQYPKMHLFAELKKDEAAINVRARIMIREARKLLNEGKPDEARELTKKTLTMFAGFAVSKEAAALMKLISPPAEPSENASEEASVEAD